MTNMEWCVANHIAATDLYCTRNDHKKPTKRENSCYIIREVHGFVYSEFEDDAIGFDKVILHWLATVYHNDCDIIYEAYHKGFLEGYEKRKEEEKKEAEKKNNKKAMTDKMNEDFEHEFESCFFGEEW